MDGNLKEFWDLQEVRKYVTFFQQDGALMHRKYSLHNGSRAVMLHSFFTLPTLLTIIQSGQFLKFSNIFYTI